jgi:hypothetical protein
MKKKRSDSASSHTCSQLQFRHQKRREVSLLVSFCPTSQGCRHTERVWTIACDSQAKAGRSSSRGLNWKEEGKEREGKPVPVFSLAWDDIQPILPTSTSSRHTHFQHLPDSCNFTSSSHARNRETHVGMSSSASFVSRPNQLLPVNKTIAPFGECFFTCRLNLPYERLPNHHLCSNPILSSAFA